MSSSSAVKFVDVLVKFFFTCASVSTPVCASSFHGCNKALTAAARELGCETVFSENLSDGQSCDSVRLENPFRGLE